MFCSLNKFYDNLMDYNQLFLPQTKYTLSNNEIVHNGNF